MLGSLRNPLEGFQSSTRTPSSSRPESAESICAGRQEMARTSRGVRSALSTDQGGDVGECYDVMAELETSPAASGIRGGIIASTTR